MTLRLVGLMSVVLLLSLAAFGLLMAHYQDQVMAEVAHTASAVGKATLRTLEHRGGPGIHAEDGNVFFWEPETVTDEVHGGRQMVVVTHSGGEGEVRRTIERYQGTMTTDDTAISGNFEIETRIDAAEVEGVPRPQAVEGKAVQYFISVEEVSAVPDSVEGLVLKIPRFTPTVVTGEHGVAEVQFRHLTTVSDGDTLKTTREEIHLPIPVGHYAELFDTMRERSVALFLGVFVVGVVLSTGLATHFTRPIRKLDGAIRRLSAGDLDVSVPGQGRDEIGRLSRAFNEMAGQLRVNRDRARDLVRREKLSALGRMAAGVAHDVRNPLHSIGLTLQHLSDTARPSEGDRAGDFDESLEVIRGEIGRLDRIVGNFLLFARTERHERRPVDLGELLRDTARLIGTEAERGGVKIELAIDPATPPVQADPESIRSAILNLVLNGLEAMPDGGTLGLRLEVVDGEARLEVADTGRGIPEKDHERVFDFAYTTREGGNGLGLAIVHHCVVEEHGGRVSLDSRPGEGTRVRLVLPVPAEDEA